VYDIESKLNLVQTAIDERVRTIAMESRTNSDDVVLAGPDGALRSVWFFLVGIDDVPR
jgi:hypothetical protein